MILSDADIVSLIKKNKLKIIPKVLRKNIGECHIRLHLAKKILKYKNTVGDLKKDSTFKVHESNLTEKGYKLKSKEFILGSTVEKVTIPNGYFGFVETRGNIARAGIQATNTDGHIGPGFSGNITLEITNNSNRPIIIYPKLPFVQMYVFKLTSNCLRLYNGKYQNQKGATVYRKD